MWSFLLAGHLRCESHHLDLRNHTLAPSIHICRSLSSEVHIFCLLPILTLDVLRSDSLPRIPVSLGMLRLPAALFTAHQAAEPSPRCCPQPLLWCHIGPWCFLSDLLPPSKQNPLLPDFPTTYSRFLPLRIPIFSSPRARYKSAGVWPCLKSSWIFPLSFPHQSVSSRL